MMRYLRPAIVMVAGMTLLLGIVYPLVVAGAGRLLFPQQANGSLIVQGDRLVGSVLIGQANSDPRYFWPRPSTAEYDPLQSGASNLGPTSLELAQLVRERAASFRAANGLAADAVVPPEMLFASGSGLDPHISPDAARLQVNRVATVRGVDPGTVSALVEQHVDRPELGILGEPRVNVLTLNLALDALQ